MAEKGRGARSNNSVGGGTFSGNIKCLNEIGKIVSEPCQRSETTWT